MSKQNDSNQQPIGTQITNIQNQTSDQESLNLTENIRAQEQEVTRLRNETQRLKQERDALSNTIVNKGKAEAIIQFSPPPSLSAGEFIATCSDSRWFIAGIMLVISLLGVGYILIAKPIYHVDAVLETGMRMDLLADISKGFAEETVVNEQIEILKSRKLIGKVVDDLKLDIIYQPVYFPVLGSVIARINRHFKEAPHQAYKPKFPFFELNSYCWSDEQIKIDTFDIPSDYLGYIFSLVLKEDNQYKILDEEGNSLVEGRIGEPVKNWLPGDQPSELLVSSIKNTRPGNRFELSRIPRVDAIYYLKEFLSVKEKGLESGIVQISLEGPNKNKITRIVNEMVKIFTQMQREQKSDKIALSLDFMEKQLPSLRNQVEKAEAALNNFRQHQGAVDLTKETQVLLERRVAVETELSKLRGNRANLLYLFTPKNSKVKVLDSQIATLTAEINRLDERIKTFPDREREVLSLSKDSELYSQLYAFLRNRIGQLKLVQDAPIGYVGVVDLAVPQKDPVKPNKAIIISLSVLLGFLLGIGAAFFRKGLRGAVQDPALIENKLGLPVYATVPHSVKQLKLLKNAKGSKKAVLAVAEPEDPAIESLRSLRTSLHFVLLEVKNNVIMVTGPTPGIGKTFLTVNFGAVLASAGKRVLLIDGDLRKGQVHSYFDVEYNYGLSDVIANEEDIEQVIMSTNIDNLDIIYKGTIPPNPSELLMHERFTLAIEKLSGLYDYVIIDSPPVLLVTDATIIGQLVGATLLVVKHGAHTLREIELSAKKLEQGGVNLRGIVVNDMPLSSSRYGYGDYYGYAYD